MSTGDEDPNTTHGTDEESTVHEVTDEDVVGDETTEPTGDGFTTGDEDPNTTPAIDEESTGSLFKQAVITILEKIKAFISNIEIQL